MHFNKSVKQLQRVVVEVAGVKNYLGGQMLSKDSEYFGYCSPSRQL